MKSLAWLMALSLAQTPYVAQAALQTMDIREKVAILDNGRFRHEMQRRSYSFRMEILSDSDGLKTEDYRNGHAIVTALPEERYAIRLYNPLPVRVAVNLTIDGINSISGKPSGISDGNKWMIEPYSFITIRGWQVTGGEARRFFFTDKPKSYATWRGERLGKDLSANCGVIGAAFFWSARELQRYNDDHPQIAAYRCMKGVMDNVGSGSAKSFSAMQRPPSTPESSAQLAGTGMGEREVNPTTQVAFDYDSGMYQLAQAVIVYYDFAKREEPNPFPDISYAPEMP